MSAGVSARASWRQVEAESPEAALRLLGTVLSAEAFGELTLRADRSDLIFVGLPILGFSRFSRTQSFFVLFNFWLDPVWVFAMWGFSRFRRSHFCCFAMGSDPVWVIVGLCQI